MPRKNAGHTGQPSRNPAGRGSRIQGPKAAKTYYLLRTTAGTVEALAAGFGGSGSELIEALVQRHGATVAAELKVERGTRGGGAEPAEAGDLSTVRP